MSEQIETEVTLCPGPRCDKVLLPGQKYCSERCGARYRYHARYKLQEQEKSREEIEEILSLDADHEHVFTAYSPTRCLICRRMENRRAHVKGDLPVHRLNELAPAAGLYSWTE
jgi:hypothetical protein